MDEQTRKALELARYSCNALNDTEALAAIDAALASPASSVAPAGWMKSGALLYRLTDDRKPVNRDEIRVTMADGSRTDEACSRRAGELFDRLAVAPAAPVAQPLTDEQIARMWMAGYNDVSGESMVSLFARAIERAHGIGQGGAA